MARPMLGNALVLWFGTSLVVSSCLVSACGGGCPGTLPIGGGGNGGEGGGGRNGGGGGGNGGGSGGNGGRPRGCPADIVSIGVCSPGLLGGTASPQCCPLLGLLGIDVEICLCLALDANILGLVNVHIARLDIIASILTSCGLPAPSPNFVCP